MSNYASSVRVVNKAPAEKRLCMDCRKSNRTKTLRVKTDQVSKPSSQWSISNGQSSHYITVNSQVQLHWDARAREVERLMNSEVNEITTKAPCEALFDNQSR